MGKRVGKIGRQVMTFLLIAVLGVTTLGTASVEAAANKALCVNYSFNGQNYEKNPEECGYNNNYGVCVYGTGKKTAIKKIKVSADLYIPKSALKKKGSVIDVTPYLNLLDSKGEYLGDIVGRITLNAVNENGKIKLYAWDEKAQKNVKASTYGSCKVGTGAYKSFYVIRMKNIPIMDRITLLEGETQELKADAKYSFDVGLSITGENNKGNGKMYIDNIKVTAGSKTIVNYNFSKKPKYYSAFNRGKEMSNGKIKISNF